MKIPFQFSIRELLLLTLSIAALLALARTYWKQSLPLQGTELSNVHFIPSEVQKLANEQGWKGYIANSMGAGGRSEFSRRALSGKYSFLLPVEYHDAIIAKLRESIEDKITSEGCGIYGRTSGNGGYEWTYSNDTLDGVAELMTVTPSNSENRLHIMFLVIESSKPKQR